MENRRKKAFIPKNECVACGCCQKACPREAIKIIKGCYAAVDTGKCVGCLLCAKACPASIITINQEAEDK